MLNPMGNRHYAFSRVTFKGYKTLVSLMHVNNGTILDLERIGRICQEHKVLFHSDTVQSIGKMNIDLQSIPLILLWRAPIISWTKRSWFCLYSKNSGLQPLFFGGNRKKDCELEPKPCTGYGKSIGTFLCQLRSGAESYYRVKNYLIIQLKTEFPDFKINGTQTIYTVLNVLLPFAPAKQRCYCFI
jgi:cysteine desulfurase